MSKVKKGIAVFVALTILFLLTLDSRFAVDAFYLTLVPLVLFLILLLRKPDDIWKEMGKKEHRFHLFLSVCFTILFVLMLSATQIAASGLYSYEKLQNIFPGIKAGIYFGFACSVYPAMVLISLQQLLFRIFLFAEEQNGEGEFQLRKVKFLGIHYYLLPIIILVLCYLLCSFPNYKLGDSAMCWDQAVAGDWNDWDPIGYIFFLRLCSEVWDSFWIVRILQSILYIYICNAALGLLAGRTGSLRACKVYVAAHSVILTPFIYLQLTYKDVLFTMSLFAFSLCLLYAGSGKEIRWRDMAALCGFGLVVLLFRHGSMVPVLAGGLILCLVLFLRKRKRECLKTAGTLVVLFLLKFLIVDLLAFQILHAKENPGYVKYSLPMVLAGAMASDSEVELTEAERTVMEIITPLEKWRESYARTGNGYWADPISRDWSTIGNDIHKIDDYQLGEALLRLNFSLFKRYPVKYLTVFFNCNSLVWEMGRPADGYEWAPVEGVCFEFAEGYPGEEEMPRTAMTNLMLQISNASNRIPILRSLTWRGGIWSFGILLSAMLLMLKRRWRDLAAVLPILTNLAMLMLAMPAQDPRYILGAIECGMFFVVYGIFAGNMKYQRDDTERKGI